MYEQQISPTPYSPEIVAAVERTCEDLIQGTDAKGALLWAHRFHDCDVKVIILNGVGSTEAVLYGRLDMSNLELGPDYALATLTEDGLPVSMVNVLGSVEFLADDTAEDPEHEVRAIGSFL
jgi:hypothetical protein